jgi:hypothetical protein
MIRNYAMRRPCCHHQPVVLDDCCDDDKAGRQRGPVVMVARLSMWVNNDSKSCVYSPGQRDSRHSSVQYSMKDYVLRLSVSLTATRYR